VGDVVRRLSIPEREAQNRPESALRRPDHRSSTLRSCQNALVRKTTNENIRDRPTIRHPCPELSTGPKSTYFRRWSTPIVIAPTPGVERKVHFGDCMLAQDLAEG
jgi:hypothetical protein